ncbi:hypothetical protein MVEN_00368900 [Mycena venus]|uniref:Uncharacterized protein n=1 Tax=Mycena venus TaxID=2733690 RepID=A0A8H6YPR3_9AGAR|nr:hypothetical protein MVEN_00368900 [Mycena venus]
MADTVFSTAWTRMLQDVCKSAIALFLGGVYFLLGVVAFYLFSRRNTNERVIFMCAIAAMLCLAIAELVMQIIVTSFSMRLLFSAGMQDIESVSFLKQQASIEHLSDMTVFVEDLILVTNNAVADGLFAYRCYLIWGPGHNKQIIVLPLLLLLITTGLGYITVYFNDLRAAGSHSMDSRIGFAFAIVTNLVLTGLTAGRIWWTRRELRIVGQEKFAQRYTNAISVLLESGAAYCLFLVLVIIALTFGRKATSGPTATFASLAYGAAGQLVNIVPTVFIVRICLFTGPDSQKVSKFVV